MPFLWSVTVLLVSMIPLYAADKYVPTADEILYGTWTNEQMFPPKWVMNPDGTYEQFNATANAAPFESGRFEIWKKWTDSEGNVWYNTACEVTEGTQAGSMFQATWKIDQSGNSAEWIRRKVSRFDQATLQTPSI